MILAINFFYIPYKLLNKQILSDSQIDKILRTPICIQGLSIFRNALNLLKIKTSQPICNLILKNTQKGMSASIF